MSRFICPVEGCDKGLSRLQVMHFRSAHGCDPSQWVDENYGSDLKEQYQRGLGSYVIASEYEWLSSDMVCDVIETRTHDQALNSENNPMKRDEVAQQFHGEQNPAKRREIREKIREAVTGHTLSAEAKEKIARKNSGKEVSEAHRKAISEAASNRDTSYMQTDAYSRAVSESLKGRELTYPTPRDVESLSHPVRSSWEEEIAKQLVDNNIEYEYEEEFVLSIGSYYPDFVVDGVVIEVKGFANKRSIAKANAFIEEHPSLTYIVVGAEIPCDIHISWEQRSELLEVFDNE